MIDDILHAINLLAYEYKDDDKVLVRMKILKALKDEIKELKAKNEALTKINTKLKIQVADLTGKIIERTNYPELDIKG